MLATGSPAHHTLPDDDWVRAAFHELHGRSLHGFSLLLTLGDVALAARLSGLALGAGMYRIDELRHPERAAAWLRAHVLRSAGRRGAETRPSPAVLQGLGADAAVAAGLGALDVRQRAAIIATSVEHLDQRDVAAIVRRDGSRLRDLLITARRRYLAAYLRVADDQAAGGGGPLADRLQEIGRLTIG